MSVSESGFRFRGVDPERGGFETQYFKFCQFLEPVYFEVDGTLINLQRKEKKNVVLKLAILYKGKEKRYSYGTDEVKKLKDTWASWPRQAYLPLTISL